MLRSFRLSNHRSFLDEQELLLIPSASGHAGEVLTVAAIYGANASGKSNLLDGLHFMTQAVTQSFRQWSADSGVPRRPFRLAPEGRARPSTFVVEIDIDDVLYTYGFSVDDERVTEEWLYSYPEKRKRVLFERQSSEIKLGTTVGSLKAKLEVLEELTRANALFLSLAAQSNVEPLMPVYQWFAQDLHFRLGISPARNSLLDWQVADYLADEETTQKLRTLLAAADTGITDLYVDELEDSSTTPIGELMTQILGSSSRRTNRHGRRKWESTLPELRFVHGDAEGSFRLADESDGTKNWLALLLPVIDALELGRILVVDEIDASLHPLLTIRLLAMFTSTETNPKHAQLIFTTHDTTPLGSYVGREVLQRDQVWFVEKDSAGASKLYPLSDFKPRIGENTEKRYLGGSYGAVPILSDFDSSVRPE